MTVHLRLLQVLAVVVIVQFSPAAVSAQVPQFDSLYVFGDSFADQGNDFIQSRWLRADPPVPPSTSPHRTYFNGRFSNGYMEFEYLWQQLSGHAPGSSRGMKAFLAAPLMGATGATNFAYGGTGTPYLDQTPAGMWVPGLKGQIELFRIGLRGRKPSTRALYAIATGANDYRDCCFNVPMPPPQVVANIVTSIETLYKLGARHVMVFDLPDLGLIPANGGVPGPASELAAFHNFLLETALNDLQVRLPALHLIQVKLDPLFAQLRNATPDWVVPALDKYSELAPPGSSECFFVDPKTCGDVDLSLFNNLGLGSVFWDTIHPTTEAHKHLADYLH